MGPLKEPYLKHLLQMMGRSEQKVGAQTVPPDKHH
jgi:hypothetical protein